MTDIDETTGQYSRDDMIDPTGFRRRARLHQSKFRADRLQVPFDDYGNRLTEADARRGLNFYERFGVFDAVRERYPGYRKPLYSDMLRSEHIPFNFFVPFRADKGYCKEVLNEFMADIVGTVDAIGIEVAPKEAKAYLKDRTSFDAYIEFTHLDGAKGVIGAEVKYTEGAYSLKPGSKEEADVKNSDSPYYSVTRECGIYKPGAEKVLGEDKFRQIWRNQLLGESLLLGDGAQFRHFTSLLLFPEANRHFIDVSREYLDLLHANDNKFLAVTYEEWLDACKKHYPGAEYSRWIDYLTQRYIVN